MAKFYYGYQAHIEHTATQAIVQWRALVHVAEKISGRLHRLSVGAWQSKAYNATPSNGGRDAAMRHYAALRDYMVVSEAWQHGARKTQTSRVLSGRAAR